MANYRDTYFDSNPSDHGWYTCVRCGRKLRRGDVDIDHIIPQSRGGADGEWNLQCMCRHCNRSKQDDTRDTVPDLITVPAALSPVRAKRRLSHAFCPRIEVQSFKDSLLVSCSKSAATISNPICLPKSFLSGCTSCAVAHFDRI